MLIYTKELVIDNTYLCLVMVCKWLKYSERSEFELKVDHDQNWIELLVLQLKSRVQTAYHVVSPTIPSFSFRNGAHTIYLVWRCWVIIKIRSSHRESNPKPLVQEENRYPLSYGVWSKLTILWQKFMLVQLSIMYWLDWGENYFIIESEKSIIYSYFIYLKKKTWFRF